MNPDFVTMIAVLAFAASASHRLSILHRKKIKYFSLLQIFYIVIIPGILFTLLFTHLQSIISRPLLDDIIVSDKILTNSILLSALFTYGGVVIHSVTKLYATPRLLRYDKTKAGEMNKFFHLKFSHNLIYSGIVALFVSLVLLEMNHYPNDNPSAISRATIKGILFGLSLFSALLFYTRPDKLFKDQKLYIGTWADLKLTFAAIWMGLLLIVYSIQDVNPAIRDYQLIIPSLVALAMVATISVLLLIHHHRKKLPIHKRLLKKLSKLR